MLTTFILTVFAWIFFRAENVSHAFDYLGGIFSKSIFSIPVFNGIRSALITIVLIYIFLFVEWFGRNDKFAIEGLKDNSKKKQLFFYAILSIVILKYVFDFSEPKEFIYFQF